MYLLLFSYLEFTEIGWVDDVFNQIENCWPFFFQIFFTSFLPSFLLRSPSCFCWYTCWYHMSLSLYIVYFSLSLWVNILNRSIWKFAEPSFCQLKSVVHPLLWFFFNSAIVVYNSKICIWLFFQFLLHWYHFCG